MGVQDSIVRSYSALYFSFRTRIEKLTSMSDDNLVSARNALASEIMVASASGKISEDEEMDLLYYITKVIDSRSSTEYLRLKKLYQQFISERIGIDEDTRRELDEEADLAFRNGYLSDEEALSLSQLLSDVPEEEELLDEPEAVKPLPPQRRKKAEAASKHSTGYMNLLKDYKELYSSPSSDMKNRVRVFFDKVGAAYRDGSISVKEFSEFHAALDTQEAFMDDLDIDVKSPKFLRFREDFLNLVTEDIMVKQCIKQIVRFGKHRGVSDFKAKTMPITVASQQLIPFFKANEDLTTFLSEAHGGSGELLQMRLDISASTD